MSTPKGFSAQAKLDRLRAEHATIEPIRTGQHGLSVVSHMYIYVVAADAVEAGSTVSAIVATAHSALKGDIIRFTSGALNGREVKVADTSANLITLGEDLPSAPVAAVTFDIQRHKYPKVNSDGEITVSTTPGPLQYVLDGVDTEVEEDTATPANSRLLPVKVGDGAQFLSITASNQAEVAVTAALPAGSNTVGNVNAIQSGTWNVNVTSALLPTGAATEATLSALNAKVTAVNTGAVVVSSSALPTGAATEATLSALNAKVTAVDTGAVTISAALPAGTNNIGDVDVLSLPSLPAGTNNIGDVDVLSLPSLPAGTNNIGDVDVLSLPALPAGTNSIGTVVVAGLDVVDLFDTPLLDTSGTNIPGSASNPVQVVASLAAAVKAVDIMDTTGGWIGLYTGAALSEVLKMVIGPGMDRTVEVAIPAATRISLRSLTTSAISSGEVSINFIG